MKMLPPVTLAVLVTCSVIPITPANAAPKHTELSSVVSGLLTRDGQTAESYEDLKKFVAEIKVPESSDFSPHYLAVWSPHYQGSITLAIHGKPYGADPMTEEDRWHVEVDGQNVTPVAIQITPVSATTDAGNAAYFTKAGFTLEETACQTMDSGNYAILYTIGYPGRKTAYIEITNSTGTAGTFLSYTLFWDPPVSTMLPDAMKPGHCPPLK